MRTRLATPRAGLTALFFAIASLCFVVMYATGPVQVQPLWRSLVKALTIESLSMALLSAMGLFRRLDRAVAWMMGISLFLCIWHYTNSNLYEYSVDVNGHISYIRTIALEYRLPDPQGWQAQQPPLYYLAAAVLYKIGEWLGNPYPVYVVRLLSLSLYIGFVAVSLLTLQRLFTRRRWLIAAAAMVLFWPDGFTYAGRLSNDLGILFMQAVVLYFLVRWNETHTAPPMRRALYASFTALIIKGSGIISLGATGLLALFSLYRKEIRLRELARPGLIAYGLFCLGLYFGRTLYYRLVYGMNTKWFINLELDEIRNDIVANLPYHYLYFDIDTFIRFPFWSSATNNWLLFWNSFFKSLLLGGWVWKSPLIASCLSALFIIILFYVLYLLFCRITFSNIRAYLPLLVTMGCMIAAVMAARIIVPWPCQANARYVFDLSVILAILFTRTLEVCAQEERPLPLALGLVVLAAFCLLSVALILLEHAAILGLAPAG